MIAAPFIAPFIMITRPAADGAALADAVTAAGFRPLSAPLLAIHLLPENVPDLRPAAAAVFTSANAVRAVRDVVPALPVYAVGPATGRAARAAGFADVTVADGDAVSLNALLARAGLAGPVYHLSGRDIAAPIIVPGVAVRRYIVYEAEKIFSFQDDVVDALRGGTVAAVTILSARTGAAFADAVAAQGLTDTLKTIKALCISDTVLHSVANLPWRGVAVANHPDMESVCALLAEAAL